MTKAKYRSDAFEAIHTSVAALQRVGAIDTVTMRKFDASCLATPSILKPAQIKRIRKSGRGEKAWVGSVGVTARSVMATQCKT